MLPPPPPPPNLSSNTKANENAAVCPPHGGKGEEQASKFKCLYDGDDGGAYQTTDTTINQ
jgi:hypothetical protein